MNIGTYKAKLTEAQDALAELNLQRAPLKKNIAEMTATEVREAEDNIESTME